MGNIVSWIGLIAGICIIGYVAWKLFIVGLIIFKGALVNHLIKSRVYVATTILDDDDVIMIETELDGRTQEDLAEEVQNAGLEGLGELITKISQFTSAEKVVREKLQDKYIDDIDRDLVVAQRLQKVSNGQGEKLIASFIIARDLRALGMLRILHTVEEDDSERIYTKIMIKDVLRAFIQG